MMILRNFRHTFRRFALANTLNILGLALGFASFFVIMTQVDFDWNFDRQVPDYQNIIRINTRGGEDNSEQTWISRPMAEIFETASAHITGSSLSAGWSSSEDIATDNGDIFQSIPVKQGFGDYMAIFGCEMLTKIDTASQLNLLIPECLAKKLYGTTDCVGQNIYFGPKEEDNSWTVSGVYRDMAENSTFGNLIYPNFSDDQDKDDWRDMNYNLYLRLDDIANVDDVIQSAVDKINSISDKKYTSADFSYTPLAEVHFSHIGNTEAANKSTLWLLIAISVVIVLVATINYINFNLGETPMRIRSINTQKVLGADILTLRIGLVGESVMVSVIGLIVAAISLCAVNAIGLSDIVEGDVSLSAHPLLAVVTLGIAIAAGLLAGIYPAVYATSIEPAIALKGSFGLGKSGRTLRTGLLCMQFAVAYTLIIFTSMMYEQSRHITNYNYGYDKDAVMICRLTQTLHRKSEALISELKTLPGIENASTSQNAVGTADSYQFWGRGDDEHMLYFYAMGSDYRYPSTLGIKITEGRDFLPTDKGVYIFNEAARRKFPWLKVGEAPSGDNITVVGFCEDFNFRTLRAESEPSPMAFCIYPESYGEPWFYWLTIRISKGTDKAEVMRAVQAKMDEMNGYPYDYKLRYMGEATQMMYKREMRFGKQMILFAALAIAIGIVGVFGMTMFESEYRRREIGIRKVMGSTTGEVLGLFCRRYVWLLCGSFVVAAPIGYLLSMRWLDSFADKAAFSPWVLIISFVAVVVVTLATVIIQAWNVAQSNPADAVRAS